MPWIPGPGATAGADTFEGTAGADTANGGAGNDTLYGAAANDTLSGEGDNDTIYGGDGIDSVSGGDGDDALVVTGQQDNFNNTPALRESFDGGDGTDTLRFEGGLYNAGANYLYNTFKGHTVTSIERLEFATTGGSYNYTEASFHWNDLGAGLSTSLTIVGDEHINQLMFLPDGGGAFSLADAIAGFTFVNWGPNDRLGIALWDQTTENGQLTGSQYDDVLGSGRGNDILNGGDGNDHLFARGGVDQVFGGAGNDLIVIGAQQGNIAGGAGLTEVFNGGAGVDTLILGNGNPITGGTRNVFAGHQVISIERLSFQSTGSGVSAEAYFYFNQLGGGGISTSATIIGDNNNNLVMFGVFAAGAYSLAATTFTLVNWSAGDRLSMIAFDTITATVNLTGSIHDDYIVAAQGADLINGGLGQDILAGLAGNDTINGGAGNDIIAGGVGDDQMDGGAGDDYFYVNQAGDVVTELKNKGVDTVESAVNWALGNHLENLTITGSALNATGNGQKNVIIGNAGNNTIDGKGLGDEMFGGLGDDVYVTDHIGDVVTEGVDAGTDTIRTYHSRYLSANVENLVIAGTDALNGGGNELNNVIRGNDAINSLYGEGGDDLIYSGLGNDRLFGGTGADAFLFNVAPSETNRDTIMDFSAADDTIRLDNAIFAALGANGALNADFFRAGAAAADANDYIIYTAGGSLLYDADGNGAGAAVRFAIVQGTPALTAADFLVT